ncbi:outer membrane beta-barrel protein, partial [Flavobacteriales bacterium]|nr:outer membrane beta-barrel protein [Flavobacteriales bacterium]
LYVDFGLRYKNTQILHTNAYTLNTFENASDTLDQFGRVVNQETHNWIRLPIGLTYKIPVSQKLYAHFSAGASIGYLFSSNSTFSRSYISKANLASVSGPQEDRKIQRNTFNYWTYGGIGISYQVPLGNIFLDVRYNLGLRNMTNEINRYVNPTILYKYLYVDDNFKLDDMAITVGFSRYLYNPKKKEKKKKTTSASKRNKDLE